MLVFIDETGSNSRDARRKFDYSLRGKPVKAVGLYGRGKHLSAISAISVEGNFGCHITEGGVDAEVFQQFLYQYLIPKLMPFNGTNPCTFRCDFGQCCSTSCRECCRFTGGIRSTSPFFTTIYTDLIKMQLRNVLLK